MGLTMNLSLAPSLNPPVCDAKKEKKPDDDVGITFTAPAGLNLRV